MIRLVSLSRIIQTTHRPFCIQRQIVRPAIRAPLMFEDRSLSLQQIYFVQAQVSQESQRLRSVRLTFRSVISSTASVFRGRTNVAPTGCTQLTWSLATPHGVTTTVCNLSGPSV